MSAPTIVPIEPMPIIAALIEGLLWYRPRRSRWRRRIRLSCRSSGGIGRRRAIARRRVVRLRTVHLAGRRQDGVSRLNRADGLPAPTCPLFVELGAGLKRAKAADIQVREELMIVLAQPRVAAVESLGFDAFEL